MQVGRGRRRVWCVACAPMRHRGRYTPANYQENREQRLAAQRKYRASGKAKLRAAARAEAFETDETVEQVLARWQA